jgi:hypothetical protein
MEKFSDKSEKNKNKKKMTNDGAYDTSNNVINNNKSNKAENIYFSEYRDSNTSEISNCDDNNFFSPDNSPVLTSSDYKKMEKVPLLEETITKNDVLESTNNSIDKNENNKIGNENLDKVISSSQYIPLSLDSLILNLKIISKLKPGYKISVKDNNEIYIDTSYLQYIYRLFSDNSRDATTTFLETLDKQITSKIEEIVQTNNNMFLNSKENILLNLSHNLNLSLIGLNNLINTYSTDEYTIAKIELIINNFELKIRKISNILKVI